MLRYESLQKDIIVFNSKSKELDSAQNRKGYQQAVRLLQGIVDVTQLTFQKVFFSIVTTSLAIKLLYICLIFIPIYLANQLDKTEMYFTCISSECATTVGLLSNPSNASIWWYLSSLPTGICSLLGFHNSSNRWICPKVCSTASFKHTPNESAYKFWGCALLVSSCAKPCPKTTVQASSLARVTIIF